MLIVHAEGLPERGDRGASMRAGSATLRHVYVYRKQTTIALTESLRVPFATRSLECYLPRLLHDHLAQYADHGTARLQDAHVAVLLSDVQGFTTLVERYSRAGRSGLEELTWRLNEYFADLVAVVSAHGGDIVSIAGDAFLCVWHADSAAQLPDACAAAAAAGLALQAQRVSNDGSHAIALDTRIGIGAGPAYLATVGGTQGRWEMLVSGPALEEAVASEARAHAGDVVMSPAAWSLVSARGTAHRNAAGALVLERMQHDDRGSSSPRRPLSAEVLQAHVPPAVLDRLQSPSPTWLAESRAVSVLFTSIPPIAGGADDAMAALADTQQAVATFHDIVARYEGTAKLDIDGKGTLLVATWGLPPRSHEDDATRAVRAALDLRHELAKLNVLAGIGVATGRVICGAFGSDVRRDYMVRGEAINLAARLMGVASRDTPGTGIACDEATITATRGAIRFEGMQQVVVKGRDAPVSIGHPVARRDRSHASVDASASAAGGTRPTVDMQSTEPTTGPATEPTSAPNAPAHALGRSAERAQLHDAWRALRDDGTSSVRVIEGDAGLGKSMLVDELEHLASTEGAQVLRVTADAIDRATSYFAWRPLFSELLGISEEIGADLLNARKASLTTGSRKKASHLLGRLAVPKGMERLRPLLSSVLPVPFPDNDLTVEMTGDVRADNTRRLLVAILQHAVRDQPTLLIAEDMHWLDSASAALLHDVARDVQPLLVAATTRPASATNTAAIPTSSRLLALPSTTVSRLDLLTDDETDRLIARRLGMDRAPAALCTYVRTRVAGHPFFCEELVHAMLEGGAVTMHDGECRLGDLQTLDLPSTVEGVIVSRLDRLSASQQMCLKIASVVGRAFRERVVRETHPVPEEAARVGEHLTALTALELTALQATDPDLSYLFRHVTTRDVTYDLMTRAQRQPLHRSVAEWMEAAHADELDPVSALLAYHWSQAGNVAKSLTFLERAGEQAVRVGSFHEAAGFFEQALDASATSPALADTLRRARWQRGLGTARYFMGDLRGSREQLEQAVRALDRPVPSSAAGAGVALLRAAIRQAANRRFPETFQGRRRHEQPSVDDTTYCYRTLGQIYFLMGEPAATLGYLTVRGLNVAESAGPSPEHARILANMGTLTSLIGRKAWSDWYGARAVAMAERKGQYAAAAYVWHIDALREMTNGHIDRALKANDSAERLITQLGDFNLEMEAWSVRAMALATAMDCLAGPEVAERCANRARAADGAAIGCWAQLNLVDFALGRGDVASASAALDAALAWHTRPDDSTSTLLKARGVAVMRAAEERWDQAVAAARQVLDIVQQHPPTKAYFAAEAFARAVEVLADGRRVQALPAEMVTAADVSRGIRQVRALARNFWHLRARVPFLEGVAAEGNQQPDAAASAYRRAADLARQQELPYERARALGAALSLRVEPERDASAAELAVICRSLGVTVLRGL